MENCLGGGCRRRTDPNYSHERQNHLHGNGPRLAILRSSANWTSFTQLTSGHTFHTHFSRNSTAPTVPTRVTLHVNFTGSRIAQRFPHCTAIPYGSFHLIFVRFFRSLLARFSTKSTNDGATKTRRQPQNRRATTTRARAAEIVEAAKRGDDHKKF